MNSISEAVRTSLDARAASGDATFQIINLRNKLHKDLSDLLAQVDTLTWEACQTEGNFGSILEMVYERAAAITNDIENSNLHPSPGQLIWLNKRLDELTNTLQDRGQLHISDLKKEK